MTNATALDAAASSNAASDAVLTFDGVTMPKEIAAGWAPDPFIRYTVENAVHR